MKLPCVPAETRNELAVKLESLQRQTDGLQKLLALQLTFTTIYSLLLGIGACFGLQGVQRRAEDDLKQIERLRDEARRNYPAIAELSKRVQEVAESVDNRVSMGPDWAKGWKKLPTASVQQVLVAETTAAGFSISLTKAMTSCAR